MHHIIKHKLVLVLILLVLVTKVEISLAQPWADKPTPTDFANATLVQANSSRSGSVYWEKSKYYKFWVDVGQVVEVIAQPQGSLSDIALAIYNPDHYLVDWEWDSYDRQEISFVAGPISGFHFARVHGMTYGVDNNYRLSISVFGKPIGPSPKLGPSVGIIVEQYAAFDHMIRFLSEYYNTTIIQPPWKYEKIANFDVIGLLFQGGLEATAQFREYLDSEAIDALADFVQNGGGLLVEQSLFMDPREGEARIGISTLLSYFDIIVESVRGHTGWADKSSIYWRKHPLFNNVRQLKAYFGNPIYQTTSNVTNSLAFSVGRNAFIATYADVGRIVSITGAIHTTYTSRNYGTFEYFDNQVLLSNSIRWLAQMEFPSPPVPTFADNWSLLWTNETLQPVTESVPLAVCNRFFICSKDDNVYALNTSTGQIVWKQPILAKASYYEYCRSSPAYYRGKLFVGLYNIGVYCLNASDGRILWFANLSVSSRLLTFGENKVFFGSDNRLYAVNASTGEQLWYFYASSGIGDTPVFLNGKVFVGHAEGLEVVDAKTGRVIWKKGWPEIERLDVSIDLVAINSKVFVCTEDGVIYVFDEKDGNLLWSFRTGSSIYSTPAISSGKVFVFSTNGRLFCLEEDSGSFIWFREIQEPLGMWPQRISAPAILCERVLIGSLDHYFYVLDVNTGATVWKYLTQGEIRTPVITTQEYVLTITYNGKLYAFSGSYEPSLPEYHLGATAGDWLEYHVENADGINISENDVVAGDRIKLRVVNVLLKNHTIENTRELVDNTTVITYRTIYKREVAYFDILLNDQVVKENTCFLFSFQCFEPIETNYWEAFRDERVQVEAFYRDYLPYNLQFVVDIRTEQVICRQTEESKYLDPIHDIEITNVVNKLFGVLIEGVMKAKTDIDSEGLRIVLIDTNILALKACIQAGEREPVSPVSMAVGTLFGGAVGGVVNTIFAGALAKTVGLPSLLAGGLGTLGGGWWIPGAMGGVGAALTAGIARNAGWNTIESTVAGTLVGTGINVGATLALAGLVGVSLTPVGWGVLAAVGIGVLVSGIVSYIVASGAV